MPRASKPKNAGAQTELAEQAVQVKKRKEDKLIGGEKGYDLEPGDNAKFTMIGLELMRLPEIDLHDVGAVNERLDEYFTMMSVRDVKPTVAGMAMALGVHRRTLWAIANDGQMGGRGNLPNLPAAVTHSIKKAYHMMELMWEEYMVHGKINPVTGIFLAKNNFGYQDKQEMVLTPNTNEAMQSPQELERKYLEAVPDEE